MTDLSNYSFDQLKDLQTQIKNNIASREKDAIANVQQQILTLAESVGMTVAQLMNIKGKKTGKPVKTVEPRYRHPDSPELQWTGRGRKPHWIQAYIDTTGNDLDSLLIK